MTRNQTTFFHIVLVILMGISQFEDDFPAVVTKYVPFLLVVIGGIQARIAHNYSPQGEKLTKREPGQYIAPRDLDQGK